MNLSEGPRQGGAMDCRCPGVLHTRGSELQYHSPPTDNAVDGDCTRHALEKSVDVDDLYQKPFDQELAFVLPSSRRNLESSCHEEAKSRSPVATPNVVTGDAKEGGVPKGKSCYTGATVISQAAAEAWAAVDTWAWTVAMATSTVAAGGAQASGEIEGAGGSEARGSLPDSSDTRRQRKFDSLTESGCCCSVANEAAVDGVPQDILYKSNDVWQVHTSSWRLREGEACCHPLSEDSPKLPSLKASKNAGLSTFRRMSGPELEDSGSIVNNGSSVVVGGAAAVVLARISNGERAWRIHQQRIGLEKFAAHRLKIVLGREIDVKTSQHYARTQFWRGLQALRAWVIMKRGIAEANSGVANTAADALLRTRGMKTVMKMLSRNRQLHLSLQSRDDLAELHFAQQRVPWSVMMWSERAREERCCQRGHFLAEAFWEANSRRTAIARWISRSLGNGKRRLRLSAWRDTLLGETGNRPLCSRPGVNSHEHNEVIDSSRVDGRLGKYVDANDTGAEKICDGVRPVLFTQMDDDTQEEIMSLILTSPDVPSEDPPMRTIVEHLQRSNQQKEKKARTRSNVMDDEGSRPPSHPTSRTNNGDNQCCAAKPVATSARPVREGVDRDILQSVEDEEADDISSDTEAPAPPCSGFTGKRVDASGNFTLKLQTSPRGSVGRDEVLDSDNLTLAMNQRGRQHKTKEFSLRQTLGINSALPLSRTMCPRELTSLAWSAQDQTKIMYNHRSYSSYEGDMVRRGNIGDNTVEIESTEAPSLAGSQYNGSIDRPRYCLEESPVALMTANLEASSTSPTTVEVQQRHNSRQCSINRPVILQCDAEGSPQSCTADSIHSSNSATHERWEHSNKPFSKGADSIPRAWRADDTINSVSAPNRPCGERCIDGKSPAIPVMSRVCSKVCYTSTGTRVMTNDCGMLADENGHHPKSLPEIRDRGDSDELEADPLEHLTNLNETGAMSSYPACDQDGSKRIGTIEGTTRDYDASTRRLRAFSLPPLETSSLRGVRTLSRAASHVTLVTAKRSAARRRRVVGVDGLDTHPEDLVSAKLKGENASTVTVSKHGFGKGRPCNNEDSNKDSYAGERRSRIDYRSGVRPKEIDSDGRYRFNGDGGNNRVEVRGSKQVTNQSAAVSACYSSVHSSLRKRDALGERLANAFWCRRQRTTCLREWLSRFTSNNVQRRSAVDRIARVSKYVKLSSFNRWRKAHAILLVRQTAAEARRLRQETLPRLCASASFTSSCSAAIVLVALRKWHRRSNAKLVVRRIFCAWAARVKGIRELDKHCWQFLASRGVLNWRRNAQTMSRTRARLKTVALFMLQGAWRRHLCAWRERRWRRLAGLRLVEEYVACMTARPTRGVWRRSILKRLSGAFRLWRANAHESVMSRSSRCAAVERSGNRLRAYALAVWCKRGLERGLQQRLFRRARAHDARRLVAWVLETLENRKLNAYACRDAIAAGEAHWRQRMGTFAVELLRDCIESRLRELHRIDTIQSKRAARAGLCRWQRAARNSEIQRSASDTGDRRLRAEQLKKALRALIHVVLRQVQLHGAIRVGRQHRTRRQITTAVKIWHTWTPRREASAELLKASAELWRVWMLSTGLRALDRVARARISRRKAADIAKLYVLRICGLNRWQSSTAARGRARNRRRMATIHWATALSAKVLLSWEEAAIRKWAGSRQEDVAAGHDRRVCKERALRAWMAFTARSKRNGAHV